MPNYDSQIEHDIEEFTIKIKDVEFSFKLYDKQRLQLRSYQEKSTNSIQKVMTSKTLSWLKRQFGSIDKPPTHFEFNAKQFQCNFTRTQNYDKDIIYEISLASQNIEQENPQNKKRNELKKLQEQQYELKKNILNLQEELKKVDQLFGQKTRQLSSLTQQISKKEQELDQTIKSLDEAMIKQVEIIDKVNVTLEQKQKQLSSLTEQIAKVNHELSLKTKLIEESKKKQIKIDILKHPKYGKYITQMSKDKMQLNMSSKSVTDQMVKEIAQCDLSRIRQLYLLDNNIADKGFDFLFQNREWPVLSQIYLRQNKIQNIHSLHKIPNLQVFRINDNELSEASCTYMCEHQWKKLTHLWISFKVGLNDKCWQILLTVLQEKFPKLSQLVYSLKEDVSQKNKKNIATYCMNNSIYLSSR